MYRITPSVWGEQPHINAEVSNACPAKVQYEVRLLSFSDSQLMVFFPLKNLYKFRNGSSQDPES